MKRVLLLATTTGYQTRMFGDAADRLGVELVFATDRCDVLDDPWRDRAIPVRFHDEEASVATILEHSARQPDNPIRGVLVVGDRPTVIAAMTARELRLPAHQPPAAAVSRNKLSTRERLRDSDLLRPWFFPTSVDADPGEVGGHDRVSVRDQTINAVRQPRRHAGRRPGGLRRGVRAAANAAGVA